MAVALWTHPACLAHDAGPGHPESPERLRAVLAALEAPRFATLERHDAPRATRAELERVHAAAHVERIFAAAPRAGWSQLDPDTRMSPGSLEAALRAAGALRAAVDAACGVGARRAFCAVRPPGHHATPAAAMGFCLFDNVAVGAAHALACHGLARVAIVDFDVHHGNGTQDIFAAEPRVLYASTHQWPLYPGTGRSSETGVGNLVNVPLGPGSGSVEFRHACESKVLPALDAFRPELILVSAGFDAHRADPLAGLVLETADYGWITRELVALAERHAAGRIVSTLEGGYDLAALAACTAEHVGALLD